MKQIEKLVENPIEAAAGPPCAGPASSLTLPERCSLPRRWPCASCSSWRTDTACLPCAPIADFLLARTGRPAARRQPCCASRLPAFGGRALVLLPGAALPLAPATMRSFPAALQAGYAHYGRLRPVANTIAGGPLFWGPRAPQFASAIHKYKAKVELCQRAYRAWKARIASQITMLTRLWEMAEEQLLVGAPLLSFSPRSPCPRLRSRSPHTVPRSLMAHLLWPLDAGSAQPTHRPGAFAADDLSPWQWPPGAHNSGPAPLTGCTPLTGGSPLLRCAQDAREAAMRRQILAKSGLSGEMPCPGLPRPNLA